MKPVFAKLIIVWMTICFSTSFAQKLPDNLKNEEVIRQYYAAYEKKDWHMLELILADGFTFTSPAGDDHINLKLYKERCWPNANECCDRVGESSLLPCRKKAHREW